MIPRHAYLNDLAEHKINELTQAGHTVTPADAVMLNAICWQMKGIGGEHCGGSRGRAVEVCKGVWLRPLTIQAMSIIEDMDVDDMPADRQLYVMAYLMAHGNEPRAFDCVDVIAESVAWGRKLHCTIQELELAVMEINRQSQDYPTHRNENPGGGHISDLVSILQRRFGETAEYWESAVSVGYALGLLYDDASEKSGKSNHKAIELTQAMAYRIKQIKERGKDGKD
jgi:hypothetical protein